MERYIYEFTIEKHYLTTVNIEAEDAEKAEEIFLENYEQGLYEDLPSLHARAYYTVDPEYSDWIHLYEFGYGFLRY